MFSNVIAAVDGTRASFEAGRQAARLTARDGRLTLLAVADPYMAMANQWGPGMLVRPGETDDAGALGLAQARLAERAEAALAAVTGQVGEGRAVERRVARGRPWDVLRDLAEDEGADLIALGAHGGRRLAGIALGSTATELLHEAPCSVLVARPAFAPAAFPSSVVVGIDGSAHAMAALDVAKALVGEGGGRGTAVAARGCDMAQDALARLAAPLAAEVRTERAVDALVEAAATADLLVVGARGVTGLASLGSVSERVAHRAESSVLVVRTGG